MILDISQEGRGRVEIFQEIPKDMEKYLIAPAEAFAARNEEFKLLMQEFKGEGFSAWYSRYWMKKPVVLAARGGIPILELRIALSNQIRGTWDRIPNPVLPEYYFQMGFVPHVLTRAIFDSAPEYRTFDIHFSLGFLEKLGIDYKSLDRFIGKILKDQPAELSRYPHRCTPRMMDSVHAVLSNHYTMAGKIRTLDIAVHTILLEALEVVGKDEMRESILKDAQREKIEAARALIEADCPLWRGNEKICQATGLNEFSLNFGFKQLYDETPYEYFLDIRLEKGRELLRQGKTVVSVALELEYATANPFIAMFKAKYGYTPKEFQKLRL
jgi:AraC-like DNA-binding protein